MTPHEIAVRICEATISLAWQEEHAAIEAAIAKAIADAREEAAMERERFVCPECGCDAACRALARKTGGV